MKIDAACPECGYKVDDASGIGDVEGDRPTPGTVALCIRCAGIGIYVVNPDGETLGIRLCTPAEKYELSEDEALTKARLIVERMNLQGWFT